ncbi:MAG: YceI family protein [Saprospiraceae bacterium]
MRGLSVFLSAVCIASNAGMYADAQSVPTPDLQQSQSIQPDTFDPNALFGHSPGSDPGSTGEYADTSELAASMTQPDGSTNPDETVLSTEPGDGEFYETYEVSPDDQVWVKLIPYIWATQVNGNLTVNGITAPLNLDLTDLWKLLEDGEVRGGFMGHLEFGRDDWSIFVNGDIISMDPSVSSRRATLETGLTMSILEMGGAIDIYNANELDPNHSPMRVQLLGGARYYSMDVSAILSLPNINPVVQVAQGEQWVDLFTGARVMAEIKPGLNAVVRGDWGGFGIGSSSNKVWNLVAAVTMDLGYAANLLIGYRFLDIDQGLHGGTGSPQGFGVNALLHGPLAGLVFQY